MKQNSTVLIAMVVSIILLATSQWFWLNSEYGEQKRTLFTNSGLVFNETVRAQEDSLYSRWFASMLTKEEAEKDKKEEPPPPPKPQTSTQISSVKYDTVQVILSDNQKVTPTDSALGKILNDSTSHLVSILEDSSVQKIMVRIESRNVTDSINNLKRIVTQLPKINTQTQASSSSESTTRSTRHSRRRFLSSSVDSLDLAFNKRIKDLGYNLQFEIKKDSIPLDSAEAARWPAPSEWQRRLRTAEDSVLVNGVMILNPEIISAYSSDPLVIFRAYPVELRNYLYSKIRSNILFSCFLIFITLVTFAVIYRNLLRQQTLNNIKNDLISNISHELKTPLATLSVALEALQQFGLQAKPETTQEYLQISRNEVGRLSLMVDNILKTSLLEKHGVTLDVEEVNIKEIVEEVVKSWKTKLNANGHDINLDIKGDTFIIQGDKLQIFSILNNLIDNATKYAKDKARINLSLISHASNIELKVSDNGIGIPKEYQSQVFEKFFRVPTGDRHNVKGYGLGLSFVKHIMELHKGVINLKSNDHGTTFKLVFPR